jgi:hypothetical protein
VTPTRRLLVRSLTVVAAWTVFGLLIAEQSALQLRLRGEERPLFVVLAPPLCLAWIWALSTPLVVAATRRLRAVRERRGALGWVACLAGHAALAATLMLLGTAIWTWIKPFVDGVATPWATVVAYSIVVDTACYVAIVTLAEAAAFAAAYRERDREAMALARTAAELQERLDEARLRALEAQLRPHFLYNTLNLIAELVHDEPEAADDMLTRLGLLLRRAYRPTEHLVPLGDELDFVLAYAGILARRYRDRVTLVVDVPDELRALPVPAFALQPLVENAFRHGVERRELRTHVEIAGRVRDGALVLRVTDRAAGVGRRDAAPRRRRWHALDAAPGGGDGIGLRNTRERLRAIYGSRAGLALDHRAGETTATVRVPAAAPGDPPFAPRVPALAARP